MSSVGILFLFYLENHTHRKLKTDTKSENQLGKTNKSAVQTLGIK